MTNQINVIFKKTFILRGNISHKQPNELLFIKNVLLCNNTTKLKMNKQKNNNLKIPLKY